MAALSTAKTIEVLFESYAEQHEKQDSMLALVDFEKPNGADLQNSSDTIWRPIQQNRPNIKGWDLSGQETGIIEENVPLSLEEPNNDLIELRADDTRDFRFWERAGMESANKQCSELNKEIALKIAIEGAIFTRDSNVSAFDFVSLPQTIMDERQIAGDNRSFILNNRANRNFASDLAGRQTLQGRPEDAAWKKGFVGRDIADFDIYKGSFLGNLVGGTSPDTTVTATVSEKPEGSTKSGGLQGNIDYRTANISVVAAGGYNVGDKISFTGVNALALQDKTDTSEQMTFTVVEGIDPTTIRIFPKPIALDDPALSVLEAASANINTQIVSGAVVTRLNVDPLAKSNIFFEKDAVCVLGGTIPAQRFSEFGGLKVVTKTLKNGQEIYCFYDGSIEKLTFKYRLFTWWGVNVINPSACGVAVSTL